MRKNKQTNLKSSNRSWRTMNFYVLLVTISLFAAATISAQTTTPTIIYNNGNLATGQVSQSGVAAPVGTQWSEVQNNQGNTAESNTVSGFSCFNGTGTTQFRLADDFVVPTGQTWTISEVIAYGYQTGSTGTTSPFTAGTIQIWNGRPGDPGATVIFGDLTTNRLGSSINTNLFRVFNTVAPPPGSAPGTTRRLWENHLTVSPGLALTAGTYWVDYRFQNAASGSLFCPSVTEEGVRTLPGDNGRQFNGTAWVDIEDTGNPASAPIVPQDLPFKLAGTRMAGGNQIYPTSREFDFDGDNRTDPAVVRSANATSQSTWYILSNGTLQTAVFGLGVGKTGGDIAVPADYDGDGRTDIAVWRSGAQGYYYILRSTNNTFRSEPFGQTGDNPRVVGDYDGDGKADPAVFRPLAQSFFAYRGSLNNPNNNIYVQPFGTTGDVPIPGDFDGDRRYDYHVARPTNGNYVHYELRSTAGFRAYTYGFTTDKIVPGQFDNDTKTDIAAVRTVGGIYRWFILRSESNLTKTVDYGNAATDTIVTGDYDGDLETDIAIRRSDSNPNYLVLDSNRGPVNYVWGISTDYPVANFDVF